MSRVLIVDDDESTLITFRRGLELEGFDVVAVGNAREALRAAREPAIGLIIADLRLPDQSGIELLRNVRSAGLGVPFVIVTGFGSIESALDAIRSGATDYLEKPLWIERLVQVTRTHLREQPERNDSGNPTNLHIVHAMRLIESRFRDPTLTPRVVAAHTGISLEHLSRLFKSHMNCGLLSTIKDFRLTEARALLTSSHLSIKEVAYRCGFSSVNQFERDFKRSFRHTPKAFRLTRT